MRESKYSRIGRINGRILTVINWKKTWSREDYRLLDRLRQEAPATMWQIEDEFRLWAYEGKGPDTKLPKLYDLIDEGRRLRAEARQKQREQAEALSRSLDMDVDAEKEQISRTDQPT